MRIKPNATSCILFAMILGVAVGYTCHLTVTDSNVAKDIAGNLSLLSDVFLRLIKMVIAPLVFATLTVGIAHMGDATAVGRVGAKALGWFAIASFISLLSGLLIATVLQPGAHLNLQLPATGAATHLNTDAFSVKDFITHLVPKSITEAMANNEILQIVVFSVFFGIALPSLGETGKRLTGMVEDLAQVMLKITGAVMRFAPVAVFAAIASTITTQGLGILLTFAKLMSSFYLALVLLWGLLMLAGVVFLGKRTFSLIRLIREPFLLTFATASSEAAYSKLLDALDRFGVNRKISSFVLPMGYSFNLDGSMMYCTFAVLFIAQAYGIHLPVERQLAILLLLMVTSKGMAGVPRASLVVIAATLNQFNLPEAGLLLIMGIDMFLDMGRSATNVVGNSVAAAVIAKWEGLLGERNDGVDSFPGTASMMADKGCQIDLAAANVAVHE